MRIAKTVLAELSWLVACQHHNALVSMMTPALVLSAIGGADAVVGSHVQGGGAEVESREDFTLYSCADILGDSMAVRGEVLIAGEIVCDSTGKTLVIAGGHAATFISERITYFKNVHFRVEKEGSAKFVGGAQVFERDEGITRPIFQISGDVQVEAFGWIPQHMGGGEDDEGGLVRYLTEDRNDAITTGTSIAHFTRDRFIVANNFDSKELATKKAGFSKPRTPPRYVLDPSTIVLFDDAMKNKPDAAKDHSSSVRGAPLTADTSQAAPASCTLSVSDDTETATKDFAATSANGANDAMPHSSHWTNARHDGRRAVSFPPFIARAIGAGRKSIKVGDELVWPSSLVDAKANFRHTLGVDGSILESRIVDVGGEVGSTKIGSGGGSGGGGACEVVAPADPHKVARVMYERFARMKEMEVTGLSGAKLGKQTTVMKITDRGVVEVYLDGVKVLSKSGPHAQEWRNKLRLPRKKSQGYTLHVAEGGFEVRLHGKRVWGAVSSAAAA